MNVGGPVTDEAVERRIQDAAHVLLDLCTAQNSRMPDDFSHPREMGVAQALSMAVQAVFMADYINAGEAVEKRLQGYGMEGIDMRARFFGLGVGVGHCIGAVVQPAHRATALHGVMNGIVAGQEARAEGIAKLRKGGA